MSKNYFSHYNYSESSSKNKSLNITQFYGVDYSPAQLQVADNHAVEIDNIVYKDRVNQKRQGYEQLFQVDKKQYYISDTPTAIDNSTNINGVYTFTIDGVKYMIFHIGNLLYSVSGIRNQSYYTQTKLEMVYDEFEDNAYRVIPLNDAKSVAFYQNKRLYILDGVNYWVLKLINDNGKNRFKIYKVENDIDTFIPTTMIGITYKDSNTTESRTVLDDANMITEWRKNKLISGTWNETYGSARTSTFYEYELDSSVNTKESSGDDLYDTEISIDTIELLTSGGTA